MIYLSEKHLHNIISFFSKGMWQSVEVGNTVFWSQLSRCPTIVGGGCFSLT